MKETATTTAMAPEARAAEALRIAGDERRAALLAEIERQEAAEETTPRAILRARADAIAEARREARRTRETVALARLAAREAAREGDEETAAALLLRAEEAEEIKEAAAVALAAIDPRARLVAPDFLAAAAERPEEMEKAIAAATYKAAQVMARHIKTPAAAIYDRFGEDARQEAFADCLAMAGDPARADMPLALFLSRVSAAALSRAKYGEMAHPSTALVDLDYHPAGIIPAPEAATIAADRLPRALALVEEEYRDAAEAVARADAAGISHRATARALAISPRMADYLAAALRLAYCIIRAEDEEDEALEALIESDRHARAMLSRRVAEAGEILARAEAEARRLSAAEADEAETRAAAEAVAEARAALVAAIASPRRRSPEAKAERAETVARARAAVAEAEAEAARVAASRHGVKWGPSLSPEEREAAAIAREEARFTYAERVAMMAAR